VAAEADDSAIGHVERLVSARVAAVPDPEGVVSWLERYLDRGVAFDGADGLAIDCDVEDAAPELESEGRFPSQLERC
jgi:hypothetical protein